MMVDYNLEAKMLGFKLSLHTCRLLVYLRSPLISHRILFLAEDIMFLAHNPSHCSRYSHSNTSIATLMFFEMDLAKSDPPVNTNYPFSQRQATYAMSTLL